MSTPIPKNSLIKASILKKSLVLLCIAMSIGIVVGTASAIFLEVLEILSTFRNNNLFIIYFLPFAGLLTGLVYYYYGGNTNKGNNLILEEHHTPTQTIPFKIVPFVLVATWISHLFGASVGREGTAVQMGAGLADQFNKLFPKLNLDRKQLITMGITAGFASVFGTPLTAIFFSYEIVGPLRKLNFRKILLNSITSFTAHATCLLWDITHTPYPTVTPPEWSWQLFFFVIVSAFVFGVIARCFIHSTRIIQQFFNNYIAYKPLIPFFGGTVFLILYLLINDSIYLGLGIPTLLESFQQPQFIHVFILKIIFTAIVLGSGFKGGEVTPLFFIGATLGSSLAGFYGYQTALFAALGFVSVFSGATKTPISSAIMGAELFTPLAFFYFLVSSALSYVFSGTKSIYSSQQHKPFWRLK